MCRYNLYVKALVTLIELVDANELDISEKFLYLLSWGYFCQDAQQCPAVLCVLVSERIVTT